jgi:hypothetical protein
MAKKKSEGMKLYQSMGWKTHSKRSTYGHHFRDDKCLDCGLKYSEFKRRMGIK